ncbi:unnamed protein product [Ceratitis capitata]|uniref:(Mediterranean fruit fly) hypothetical protein n=1 Tax=Ceratitis capitata TaxID=7213 RepID=A0A811U2Y7_CERCA|nr:unnamed protein product [Ceratitis capitata]
MLIAVFALHFECERRLPIVCAYNSDHSGLSSRHTSAAGGWQAHQYQSRRQHSEMFYMKSTCMCEVLRWSVNFGTMKTSWNYIPAKFLPLLVTCGSCLVFSASLQLHYSSFNVHDLLFFSTHSYSYRSFVSVGALSLPRSLSSIQPHLRSRFDKHTLCLCIFECVFVYLFVRI